MESKAIEAPLTSSQFVDATAPSREAGLMTAVGVQGVGKTYQNMKVIASYVKNKIDIKVRGKKVLIYDTNGEYTESQFKENGHDVKVKLIKLSDVYDWCRTDVAEIRRIDAKHLTIPQKKYILEFLLVNFVDGLLVLEDINTYVLQIHHLEEAVGNIVKLRHKGTDCLISYQSARAVDPRIYSNSRWVRMHFQADDVDDIKNKVTNPQLYKIAQLMVNHRYIHATPENNDERFFVYITKFGHGLQGPFKKPEFIYASTQYLHLNSKLVNQQMRIYKVKEDVAYNQLTNFYYKRYYQNKDREAA